MFGRQHPGSQSKRCAVALGDQFTALIGNGIKMIFHFILDIALTSSKTSKKQQIRTDYTRIDASKNFFWKASTVLKRWIFLGSLFKSI